MTESKIIKSQALQLTYILSSTLLFYFTREFLQGYEPDLYGRNYVPFHEYLIPLFSISFGFFIFSYFTSLLFERFRKALYIMSGSIMFLSIVAFILQLVSSPGPHVGDGGVGQGLIMLLFVAILVVGLSMIIIPLLCLSLSIVRVKRWTLIGANALVVYSLFLYVSGRVFWTCLTSSSDDCGRKTGQIAFKLDDSSYCQKFKNADSCYNHFAKLANRIDQCESLPDTLQIHKDGCIKRISDFRVHRVADPIHMKNPFSPNVDGLK